MPSQPGWPVVRPLPALLIKLILFFALTAGWVLLWNDKRVSKSHAKIKKTVVVPALHEAKR